MVVPFWRHRQPYRHLRPPGTGPRAQARRHS